MMEPSKDYAQMKKEISGSVAEFKKEMELIIGGSDRSSKNDSLPVGDLSRVGIQISKQ